MANRIKWIQVAKGIGIILVITGHTITTSLRESSVAVMKLYDYIYFFHMAFFFYLSGRTYLLGKFKKEYVRFEPLKKNSTRLLVPYFSYAVIVYLLFLLINTLPVTERIAGGAGYGSQSPREWLLSLLTGSMKYSSHLWFVYALFLMRTLTDVIERIFYRKWMGICFALSIGFLILSQLFYNPNLEILNRTFLLYIWFMAGIRKDFSFVSLPKAVLCGIIGNVYWVLRYLVLPGAADSVSTSLLVRYCDQAVKVFLLIFLVRLSYEISKNRSKLLEYLGNQSFHIYLLHQPFFCSVVSVILFNSTALPAALIIPITFITALSCSLLIIKVTNHKRIKKYSGLLLGNR